MKPVLLALVCGVLLFAAASVAFNLSGTKRRARALLVIYLVVLALLVVLELTTPANLGILPPTLVTPLWWVDLGFAVFLFSAGFFGCVLQLYNLADRGFSLRIMIDILGSPGGLTADEIMTGYSAGRGIPWMYQKRLDGLVATGLVRLADGQLFLTPKGERTARLFGGLQEFARVRPRKAAER